MSAAIDQPHFDKVATSVVGNPPRIMLALCGLLVLYVTVRILEVFPVKLAGLAVIALHVLAPAIFAALHGGTLYRIRGIVTFFAISIVIGNIFENLGVVIGWPFGRYYFTDLMGPKLFHVPILLGLAYVGMGYLSWVLALAILGETDRPLSGSRVVTLPLVASFIMVAWDLSQDPVWSTILHGWVWVNGGAYFGVPVGNFLGWFFDVYIIYQLWALYLRGRPVIGNRLVPGYWEMAVLFYAAVAAGNVLQVIPRSGPSVVSDPTGAQWRVSDITGTCALVSIFTMGAFAALAWVRLMNQQADSRQS